MEPQASDEPSEEKYQMDASISSPFFTSVRTLSHGARGDSGMECAVTSEASEPRRTRCIFTQLGAHSTSAREAGGRVSRHGLGEGGRQALMAPLQPKPTEGAMSSLVDGLPSPRGLIADNETEAAQPGLALKPWEENQTEPERVRFLPGPFSPAVGERTGSCKFRQELGVTDTCFI